MDPEQRYWLFDYLLTQKEQQSWLDFGKKHVEQCGAWAGNLIKSRMPDGRVKVEAHCIDCNETIDITDYSKKAIP